ncbi:FixH family protein [Cohnella lubricantis]|uniref:FixH family protein n=2 Tax=Cohnella lubricantis TaxID=2163172 RepID=A0A841TG28_9BACL|nr:FixH family protein [Cohnella lubricantis]
MLGGGAALAVIAGVLGILNGATSSESVSGYEDGGFQVSVQAPDSAVRVMKPAEFTVTATGANGQPVANADLRAVLYMPDMFCGLFEAEVTEISPGVYEVQGVPVMKGKWVAKLTLASDGNQGTFVQPFKVS